ncbi:hypothetical protein PMAYCL1PPCAC_09313, partial [Pristionchus mayeri]
GVASVAVAIPIGSFLRTAAVLCKGKLAIAGIASSALAIARYYTSYYRPDMFDQIRVGIFEVFFIFAMALSCSTQGLMMGVRAKLSVVTKVREANAVFSGWFKSVFYSLRVSTTLATFVSVTESLYAL